MIPHYKDVINRAPIVYLSQIVFIFKKKKKNTFWDMDKLSHWSHVSGHAILQLNVPSEVMPELYIVCVRVCRTQ